MPKDINGAYEWSPRSPTTQKSSYYHEPVAEEVKPKKGPLHNTVEEVVRNQRWRASELAGKYHITGAQKSFAVRYMSTRTNAEAMLNNLKSEQIQLERVGIISVAALTGVIINYKRSFLRKTGYSLLFGSTATAICYPKMISSYASLAYDKVKEPVVELYTLYGPGSDYKPITTAVLTRPEYYSNKPMSSLDRSDDEKNSDK